MGCSHATGCPLFPLLNASLQGWRDYYCDSADQWRACARYKLSLTGERVPITLLPNGHRASHLGSPAEPEPSDEERISPQAWPPGCAADTASRFEPAPLPRPLTVPHPQDGLARHTRRAANGGRGWLARLTDWMRGPA